MIKKLMSRLQAPFFSPKGFFLRACEIMIVFGILSAVGFQKYVGALFGTAYSGSLSAGVYFIRTLGITYGIFYFAALLLAPILLIASILFWCLEKRFSSGQGK